jgi:hypothetical protein
MKPVTLVFTVGSSGVSRRLRIGKAKPRTAIRWADKIGLKNRASSRRKVFVINNLGIRNILK